MLNKRKILVTRPVHQATSLCEEIKRKNGLPVLFPTLEIMPISHLPQYIDYIKNLGEFDILIFTSANSLLFLPSCIEVKHSIIVAMGPGTAEAVRKHGIAVNHMGLPPFTSEALLELPILQEIKNKKILIITGLNSRPLLPETLKKRGAHVELWATYQRQLPQHVQVLEKIQDIDMIVTTSQESLRNLMTIVEQYHYILQAKILIVSSDKLEQLAKNIGYTKIILAKNATDASILAAISDVQASNKNALIG